MQLRVQHFRPSDRRDVDIPRQDVAYVSAPSLLLRNEECDER
jgi:hypothetical protein